MNRAVCLALIAFGLISTTSCARSMPDSTPEGAVRLWLEKMEASTEDPRVFHEAFALLGPTARANLEQRAERASRIQGRRIDPHEMIAQGRFGLKFRPRMMTSNILTTDESVVANVEIVGESAFSERAFARCVRVPSPREGDDPVWRVEPEFPEVKPLPKGAKRDEGTAD